MSDDVTIIEGTGAGAPTKLNKKVITAMKKVLVTLTFDKDEDEVNPKLLSYSYKDWVDVINENLGERTLTVSTFKNWMNGKTPKSSPLEFELYNVINGIQREQKGLIVGELLKDNVKNWQKYSWLLERKYPKDFAVKKEPTKSLVLNADITPAAKPTKGELDKIIAGLPD